MSRSSPSQPARLAPGLRAIARQQGGVFTTSQAVSAGYAKSEIEAAVRAGAWSRLRHGVFIDTAALIALDARSEHLARLRAVLIKTTRPTFASHLTAAVVHGLPVLGLNGNPVSVTQVGPPRTRLSGGMKLYVGRVDLSERAPVAGVPCLSLARTVADVARTATFEQAVVVADAALRAGLRRTELEEAWQSCIQWPGARQLARVVAFARPESESPGESLSRIVFAAQGLPEPLMQVSLYDCDGFIGRCDFLWEDHMTIAEFDGRVKYESGDPKVLYAEKRREDRLRAAGYEVVRFSWADVVRRPAWVAAQIRAAFDRHARRTRLAAAR